MKNNSAAKIECKNMGMHIFPVEIIALLCLL